MRLKNKKTGEIIETDFDLSISIPDDEKLYGCDTYTQLKGYTSLAELNEEWEDAPEEPKEYWYIDADGVIETTDRDGVGDDEMGRNMIAIGNHFKTREEAELAVRKLKAWKRLKDKKIFIWLDHFDYRSQDGSFNVEFGDNLSSDELNQVNDDLDLLFCPEENI